VLRTGLDARLGSTALGQVVLVAYGVLLDKLEYTLLRLEVYLPRVSLYTKMRKRHYFKAPKG
jgi:hypothetical protein